MQLSIALPELVEETTKIGRKKMFTLYYCHLFSNSPPVGILVSWLDDEMRLLDDEMRLLARVYDSTHAELKI